MEIETIVSILGLLGLGGIIGGYLQHLWGQRTKTELRIQNLNEGHYRSTPVWMRVLLNPENIIHFNIAREDPHISKTEDSNELREYVRRRLIEFYYSSLLYSPDDVLRTMKEFMKNPTETNFLKSAIAMRKDLWKKKTKASLETLTLE